MIFTGHFLKSPAGMNSQPEASKIKVSASKSLNVRNFGAAWHLAGPPAPGGEGALRLTLAAARAVSTLAGLGRAF